MMLRCTLCGFTGSSDREELAEHLATEHPDAWAMALDVVVMQLMSDRGEL